MKLIIFTLILIPIYVFADECKIERPDGVVLYGNCETKNKVVIFKSCAEFICQVNPAFVKKINKNEKVCKNKTNIIEEALILHQVKDAKSIPYCIKGS